MKFQYLCETLYVPRGLLPKEAIPSPRRACGEQGAEGASTGSARNARGCFTPCSPALDSAVLLEGRPLAAQPFCHFFCMLPPAGSGRSAPSSIFFFDVQELLSRFDEQMSLFLTIADVSCRLHGVWQSLVSLLALSGEAACAEERYLVGPVFFL